MPAKKLCMRCHSVSIPKKVTPGSFAVEVTMWCLFCAPGFVYSVWRLASKYHVCAACGSKEIVPVHTPAAQAKLGGQPPPR